MKPSASRFLLRLESFGRPACLDRPTWTRGRIGEGEEKGALPPWGPAARAPWPPGAMAPGHPCPRAPYLWFEFFKRDFFLKKSVPPSLHVQNDFIQTDKSVFFIFYRSEREFETIGSYILCKRRFKKNTPRTVLVQFWVFIFIDKKWIWIHIYRSQLQCATIGSHIISFWKRIWTYPVHKWRG